jgi:hypothetical protein
MDSSARVVPSSLACSRRALASKRIWATSSEGTKAVGKELARNVLSLGCGVARDSIVSVRSQQDPMWEVDEEMALTLRGRRRGILFVSFPSREHGLVVTVTR